MHYEHKIKSTAELIPYANNSRTHSDIQVQQIASSIKEWGFTNPILIDEENQIIAGHGRLLAADLIGIPEVPCIVLEGLSKSQKKAYVIADNQLALNAGWDVDKLKLELQDLDESGFNLELIGFDDDMLSELMIDPPEALTDEDAVPIVEDDPITKKGDVWLLDGHRVMCGDSSFTDDVDKLLNGRTIDLIFSDPPYGVSYADKNKFLNAADKGNSNQKEIANDHLSVDDTGELWQAVFSLWSQHLSEYSCYYIASPQGGELYLMMMMMNDNGFPVRHTIIWNKNNHVLGRCDYNYKHEPIIYGWSKKHKFYGKGDHKFSVWNIDKPLKNDLHPTMKPVALVENAILNSSSTNQIVADMFLGSGTTLIASEKSNRICYGMELDPAYCDVIVKRWQEYTGKRAMHEETGKFFNDLG